MPPTEYKKLKITKNYFNMKYNYTVTFHNSKKASFGGSADIEQLKEDGTEKTVDEIMVEVKESLLEKYKPFFAVWQDISSIEVIDNNNRIIFQWKK
ncbi:MAG TPA: hypothetical protein GX707_08345 [Epulopiscium sp.]|nr:hypothetical protein [Candidatus Epulonipiscium sp.]